LGQAIGSLDPRGGGLAGIPAAPAALLKEEVVTPVFPKKTKCKPICMPGSIFMHIVDKSE
jgi:hypothetical protein